MVHIFLPGSQVRAFEHGFDHACPHAVGLYSDLDKGYITLRGPERTRAAGGCHEPRSVKGMLPEKHEVLQTSPYECLWRVLVHAVNEVGAANVAEVPQLLHVAPNTGGLLVQSPPL
jgi:hypothetical protein